MKRRTGNFKNFVKHPRYGRGPRITGQNPQTNYGDTFIHWHSPSNCRIPNTAILANPARQKEATVAVTHYYDVERRCRDCGRMFIFFAEEQRHWYEVLRFGLDADCVRCIECRKSEQQTSHLRQCYESLLKRSDRTDKETLELIDAALTLVEQASFGHRALQNIRALLNSFSSDFKLRCHDTFRELSSRADILTEAGKFKPERQDLED